ncbi:MAG: NADH-quinone oxidoreductase subunit NuoF [Firmicutes bacterium]|nr:NADH-quinone oxidoreductase subunit NuoF [Bacillota bacterium]
MTSSAQIEKRIVLRNYGKIDPNSIDDYVKAGGYSALKRAVTQMQPAEIIKTVKDSGLRGRGGAGFPTGLKWEFAAKAQGSPKYIICNADEGEPGTYKDRLILEGDPHSVIEGMAIAARAIGASKGFFYIRGEYVKPIEMVKKAIEQARAAGFLGKRIAGSDFEFDIEVRSGAGAYVCGEETALMESIEGKRGESRVKPPYPTDEGLWGKPTVINNVETLANIAPIIENGAEWFRAIGTPKCTGTKVFTLSGDVVNKGAFEVPMGTTLRTLVFELGGGIPNGKEFLMAQVGGSAGGCLPASLLDVRLDLESLREVDGSLGSGALLIVDDSRSVLDVVRSCMKFFEHESCGKCTLCREGTARLARLVDKIAEGQANTEDLKLLERLSRIMERTCLCGLGQAAPKPILTTLKYFKDEYLIRVSDQATPKGA